MDDLAPARVPVTIDTAPAHECEHTDLEWGRIHSRPTLLCSACGGAWSVQMRHARAALRWTARDVRLNRMAELLCLLGAGVAVGGTETQLASGLTGVGLIAVGVLLGMFFGPLRTRPRRPRIGGDRG
jgi:hypothetical protein